MNICYSFAPTFFRGRWRASLWLVLALNLSLVRAAAERGTETACPTVTALPPLAQLVSTSAPLSRRARAKVATALIGAIHTGDLEIFESSFRALGGPVNERFA